MATYIATVYAKPESAETVAGIYRERLRALQDAPGFVEAKVYRAQPGRMVELVRAHAAAQGRSLEGGHQESAPEGVHFVMIEEWKTEEARVAHARSPQQQETNRTVIPHLLPEHSHEFYQALSEDEEPAGASHSSKANAPS